MIGLVGSFYRLGGVRAGWVVVDKSSGGVLLGIGQPVRLPSLGVVDVVTIDAPHKIASHGQNMKTNEQQ